MSGIKLFECKTDGVSYKQPVIRFVLSVGVLVGIFSLRFKWLHVENPKVDFILGIFCGCLIMGSILSTLIAVGEMIYVAENRAKKEKLTSKHYRSAKVMPINDIISMVEANDIIDIRIIFGDKIVSIGASSDCKGKKFFDKLYYIDTTDFADIHEFEKELAWYAVNETLNVFKIDGLAPNSKKE